MKIYIKNMVCNRCITAVQDAVAQQGLQLKNIKLGEITLVEDISKTQKDSLEQYLVDLIYDMFNDYRSKFIKKIKNIIIELVHVKDNDLKLNLSELLRAELQHDYSYLSNLFSDVEGTTIEKYLIAQKIERVKELLVYDELSLSEIAQQLNYSSVAYLSNQFKKVTGLTPSHFKQKKEIARKPLDKV